MSVPLVDDISNKRAFHFVEFRKLWYAGWMWYQARMMEIITTSWLVLEITGSPWYVAIVALFRTLPMGLFGLISGAISDRFNRKNIMQVIQIVNIVSLSFLIGLVYFEIHNLILISILVMTLGFGWSLDFPARRSSTADIVGSKNVSNAMFVDMAALTGSSVLGPLWSGLLINWKGALSAYIFILILDLVGTIILQFIHIPNPDKKVEKFKDLFISTKNTAVYMFKNPITRLVITVTVIANVLFFPFMPMVPVFAETILFVNPVLMGLLGASFGLGNVIGSTYLGTFGKSTKPIKLFIFGTSIGFIFLLIFSILEIYWICWVMLFFAGLAMTGFGSMQSAITLMTVAPNIRGKALGVIGVAIGTAPLGLLFTGIISGSFGIEVAITLNCSIALCILALSLFAYRKELFLEDAQIISQQNSN